MDSAVRRANRLADGGMRLRHCLATLLGCMFVAATAAAGAASSTDRRPASVPAEATAFNLKEISTFDVPESVRSQLLTGVYMECQTKPDAEVARYPTFTSDKPLYGSFRVGDAPTEPNAGYRYAFALDESGGTGQGYDRMYLDMNLNGDLTDDSYSVPMKNVPDKAQVTSSALAAQTCFEPVRLQVASEDDPQPRIEVIPRFLAYESGPQYAMLTPTKVRTGTIRIGLKRFDAFLGYSGHIRGRLDDPDTAVFLLPAGQPNDSPSANWYGAETLKAMHRYLNVYYRLAATPSGDQLFVWTYQGPFGTLEIKSSRRDAKNAAVTGSLASRDMAISLTEGFTGQSRQTSDSYRLPVGDYCPLLMSVTYDNLNCVILRNMHADGIPRGRDRDAPSVYAIKIREDKPFVFDFSDTPQVLFALPGKDARVEPGQELQVQAVLTDPSLGIMFRAIRESSELEPKVTIARANGEIVAEGVMPFG